MSLFNRLFVKWCVHAAGRRIRRHGFQATYVGAYDDPPAWAYTVGFDETLDHPELVLFDSPRKSAAHTLACFYDEIRAGRMVVEEGADPGASNTRCVWRKVHPDQLAVWLPLAIWRRYAVTGQRYGLEAFQLVLSDPDGRLPWEEGYDERLRGLQPALWLSPEASA
jgi:hypothetical protein